MDTTQTNMPHQQGSQGGQTGQAFQHVPQTVQTGPAHQHAPQVAQPMPSQQVSPAVQPVYAAPVKQPSGWGKLWAAFGLLIATQFVQVIFIFLGMLSNTDEGLLTVAEIGAGVAGLLFVLALGGKKLVTPSLEGISETWQIIKWIFITDLVIVVIEIAGFAFEGNFELANLWPLRVLTLLLLCAGVGLFEETTFRGLCFHGLLARMGTNRKGVFWAVIISSFIFGLMHVDFVDTNWAEPAQVIQACLKVVQTGVFGFAAAVAVLKTGNLWPVIILHGANDFMLMLVTNGLMNNPVSTDYISEGSEGLMIIALYLMLIVAYSPSVVAAVRALKEHPMPDRGQFYRARTYQPAPVYTAAPQVATAAPQVATAAPQVAAATPQQVYTAPEQPYLAPQQASEQDNPAPQQAPEQ